MALRCPDFYGVPLMNHAGSTTYFSARVVRQLSGLQTVPEDTARTRFEHTWREDQTPVDRQSNVKQILDAWRTVITERPYFPEHPILDERDFQASEEYILRFYRWDPAAHEDLVNSPRVGDGGSLGATPTPNMAIQVELTHLKAVAKKDEQLHAFTALGSDPSSGFGPASGSGPAFDASGFGPVFGFWPRIWLRPHFWASAPHRASTPYRVSVLHLLLSGPGLAFTAFGLRPSTYYIQVLTPRIYCFQAHLKSKIDLDSNSPKRYSEEGTLTTGEERCTSSRFLENLSQTLSLYFDEGGVRR
ncbi:hypothetical protein CRG98_030574 [Punica granatum]|uniref:Uncharacterized protein n=1 Tax=Punica granatum TaxID=22663 RepID=A0A2I0IYA3_PUNGR|nr:hypothetical protein CRG98_030574 [Punica granatum]